MRRSARWEFKTACPARPLDAAAALVLTVQRVSSPQRSAEQCAVADISGLALNGHSLACRGERGPGSGGRCHSGGGAAADVLQQCGRGWSALPVRARSRQGVAELVCSCACNPRLLKRTSCATRLPFLRRVVCFPKFCAVGVDALHMHALHAHLWLPALPVVRRSRRRRALSWACWPSSRSTNTLSRTTCAFHCSLLVLSSCTITFVCDVANSPCKARFSGS